MPSRHLRVPSALRSRLLSTSSAYHRSESPRTVRRRTSPTTWSSVCGGTGHSYCFRNNILTALLRSCPLCTSATPHTNISQCSSTNVADGFNASHHAHHTRSVTRLSCIYATPVKARDTRLQVTTHLPLPVVVVFVVLRLVQISVGPLHPSFRIFPVFGTHFSEHGSFAQFTPKYCNLGSDFVGAHSLGCIRYVVAPRVLRCTRATRMRIQIC